MHIQSHGPYQSLADVFQGQLADLDDRIPSYDSTIQGGQDFGVCCYRAINESLQISNGSLEFRPGQSVLRGTVPSFESY